MLLAAVEKSVVIYLSGIGKASISAFVVINHATLPCTDNSKVPDLLDGLPRASPLVSLIHPSIDVINIATIARL